MAIFLLLASCAAIGEQRSTPTPIPTPVIPVKPVYEVQRGNIIDLIRFTGRVAPTTEEELAFGVNGRVDQVRVKAGDNVLAGTLMAVLDTGNSVYDLRRAQLQVEAAQIELGLARQQMPVARQIYSMSLTEKEYQLELARIELDRLRAAGYTGENLRQAEIALELAQIAVELAHEQQELDIAADEANLALLEQELELAQIALNELDDLIDDSHIVAPFDGRVVSVSLKEDTAVEAFRSVIILVDTTFLIVRANPGSEVLQRLEEGMLVNLSPIGEPGIVLAGRIQSLPYPYGAAESGQDEVFITLDEALSFDGYNLGDLMEATVILAQKTGIIWLPPQAIRTFEGRKFVVIRDGEGQRRVDIKIGIQAEDRVEILEGLEEGQVVFSP